MKINYFYSAAILFFSCFFVTNMQAQVTIGSSLPPNVGALLDLKENNSQLDNSKKGLALPRVELTKLDALDDLGVGLNKEEHTGLVVYHAGLVDLCAEVPIFNGLYVWDGEKWENLTGVKLPDPSIHIITTNQTGLNQPNTYLVNQASTIRIPVAKAFEVWDGTSWRDENNNALLNAKNFTGKKMSVSMLWQDARCYNKLVSKLSISNTNVDQNAIIEVLTTQAYGNAVVALHIGDNGNQNDEIVWSWHIWSTPEVEEIPFNNRIWMDRNIGANSIDPKNGHSQGVFYQWGRKDPIIGSHSWNSSAAGGTFDFNGNSVTLDYVAGADTDKKVNLSNSIHKPFAFLTDNIQYGDWYSQTNQWNIRWGANGSKSVSDPCPQGWIVPIGTGLGNTILPWNGLSIADFEIIEKNPGTTTIYGVKHPVLGFFPTSGHRTRAGNMSNMSIEGRLWIGNSDISITERAKNLHFTKSNFSSSSTLDKSWGAPVRCVKE